MTTWVRTRPKARKRHFCVLCSRRIDPGETYVRGSGLDNGEAWSWKECLHCEAAMQLFDIDWDEYYGEGDFECWIDNGARSIAELRAMAGYRMRWRTKYGTLLPVPEKTLGTD